LCRFGDSDTVYKGHGLLTYLLTYLLIYAASQNNVAQPQLINAKEHLRMYTHYMCVYIYEYLYSPGKSGSNKKEKKNTNKQT